jgi:hypothetical protein
MEAEGFSDEPFKAVPLTRGAKAARSGNAEAALAFGGRAKVKAKVLANDSSTPSLHRLKIFF